MHCTLPAIFLLSVEIWLADYAVPARAHRDVGGARSSRHSRRPRKRSCDSMTDSSSCARSNPACALLGLPLRSLSIRRSAAATRSRARFRSGTMYCRDSGRVRFLRGPFAALLARMAASASLSPSGHSDYPGGTRQLNIFCDFLSRVALILGVHGAEPTTARRRLPAEREA